MGVWMVILLLLGLGSLVEEDTVAVFVRFSEAEGGTVPRTSSVKAFPGSKEVRKWEPFQGDQEVPLLLETSAPAKEDASVSVIVIPCERLGPAFVTFMV